MSTKTTPAERRPIVYPETDGEPMAENTLQYEWITIIKGGLDAIFKDDPDVFVAGDLFWYPVEGDPLTRRAPDVMVAIGRPKGHRRSYLQWEEGGIAPQVVFEILSPSNRDAELGRKLDFYRQFGVEEYYIYDPDDGSLTGRLREQGELQPVPEMNGWTSPRLGIRFDLSEAELKIYGPDNRPFASYLELVEQREAERRRADTERRRADTERRRADTERRRAEALEAQLRALGVEPEA